MRLIPSFLAALIALAAVAACGTKTPLSLPAPPATKAAPPPAPAAALDNSNKAGEPRQ